MAQRITRRISRKPARKGVAMGSEATGIFLSHYEECGLWRIKRSYK